MLSTHVNPDLAEVPRAIGHVRLATKCRGSVSAVADLRQSGASKVVLPRGQGLQAVLLNTAGGLTGGDRFSVEAEIGAGSTLSLTTQAAERAYRSALGRANVQNRLRVGAGAQLFWLPQETILFNGCAVDRSLHIDLAEDARLLMVEPLIFGRPAMAEVLTDAVFDDDIRITKAGTNLLHDRSRLSGNLHAMLAHPAIGGGAGASAFVVLVDPNAEAQLSPLRAMLPETGGASLLAPDTLVLRLLATDGFALRQTLLPILDRLTHNTLPKVWRL